jgi:hypothetical protein
MCCIKKSYNLIINTKPVHAHTPYRCGVGLKAAVVSCMEQMMELVLAKMDSFEEKLEATQERLEAKIDADHEDMADLKIQVAVSLPMLV